MKHYYELKREALDHLSGRWGAFIGISILGFIMYLVLITLGMVLLIIPGIIIACLFTFGTINLILSTVEEKNLELGMLFTYDGKVWRIVGATILVGLVSTLPQLPGDILNSVDPNNPAGVILTLAGGLVSAYLGIRLAYTIYVLRDTDLTVSEAMAKSMEMTKGHFWYLFLFSLSFIGWILLVVITFGLALFYVGPFMSVSQGTMYRYLKGRIEPELEPEDTQQPVAE